MLDVRNQGCMSAATERDRLEALLSIARKHHLSLDDLDDASQHMDWSTFSSWSQVLLRSGASNDSQKFSSLYK